MDGISTILKKSFQHGKKRFPSETFLPLIKHIKSQHLQHSTGYFGSISPSEWLSPRQREMFFPFSRHLFFSLPSSPAAHLSFSAENSGLVIIFRLLPGFHKISWPYYYDSKVFYCLTQACPQNYFVSKQIELLTRRMCRYKENSTGLQSLSFRAYSPRIQKL